MNFPDYTINMITSKYNKTDKNPTCGARFSANF